MFIIFVDRKCHCRLELLKKTLVYLFIISFIIIIILYIIYLFIYSCYFFRCRYCRGFALSADKPEARHFQPTGY